MKKQELIKHIEDLPYKEGPIVDKIDISRKGLLELVNQLDEPEKPVVPPVVSVWYQINKNNLYENIAYLCANWAKLTTYDALFDWMSNTDNFIEILINMHRFGYEVEEEPKYTVKFKATNQYLCDDDGIGLHISPSFRSNFRKSDLEKLSLTEVFDSPLFEVEEVTEWKKKLN